MIIDLQITICKTYLIFAADNITSRDLQYIEQKCKYVFLLSIQELVAVSPDLYTTITLNTVQNTLYYLVVYHVCTKESHIEFRRA